MARCNQVRRSSVGSATRSQPIRKPEKTERSIFGRPVRRNLFGPVDQDRLIADLETAPAIATLAGNSRTI
jgi:hypothetical protein